MAVQADRRWSLWPPEIREVLAWAAASETAGRDIGTKALLIGILRVGNGVGPADDLLQHFGISRSRFFSVLRETDHALDPEVAERQELFRRPPLTANARERLSEGDRLREKIARQRTPVECLFGAILQTNGSARSSLDRVLGEEGSWRSYQIASHYLDWLASGNGSYARALAERFPVAGPSASMAATDAAAVQLPSPYLAILLSRENPGRAAGLGVIVQGGLLLTAVSPEQASEARDSWGNVHRLEWLPMDAQFLYTARLQLPVTLPKHLAIRAPMITDSLRCYAVSDDGRTTIVVFPRQQPCRRIRTYLMSTYIYMTRRIHTYLMSTY